MRNIFSRGYFLSTIAEADSKTLLQRSLTIVKRFGVLCHYLKNLCQQHFKPRFGVMVDNFVQIVNSRRLVTHDKLLSRGNLNNELIALSKASAFQSSITLDIKAALKDNVEIEQQVNE